MSKAIFAVTRIKYNGVLHEAGSKLNMKDFTKEILTDLLDAGAIEIRLIEDAVEKETTEETIEETIEETTEDPANTPVGATAEEVEVEAEAEEDSEEESAS